MVDSSDRPQARRRTIPIWAWFLVGNVAVLAAILGIAWHYIDSRTNADLESKGGISGAHSAANGREQSSSAAGDRKGDSVTADHDRNWPMTVEQVVKKIAHGVVLLTTFDAQNTRSAIGSGFVIDSSGLVATNFHVLRGASSASAEFVDHNIVKVRGLRAWDAAGDLAIVELDAIPDNMAVLQLAEPESRRDAMNVIALGHPQEFKFTTTTGILSAVHTSADLPPGIRQALGVSAENTWLQTTAAIAGGSSGSPLVDMQAAVIGVNTWTSGNFGFAADVRHLNDLRNNLQEAIVPFSVITAPQAELIRLVTEYTQKGSWLNLELQRALTEKERQEITNLRHPAIDFLPRFCAFAEKHPRSPAAFDCLSYVCFLGAEAGVPASCSSSFRRAAERLSRDFANDPRLVNVMWSLRGATLDQVPDFLRSIARNSSDEAIRGTALYSLGCMLGTKSTTVRESDEAIAVLRQVVNEYPQVVYHCPDPAHPLHQLGPEAEEWIYQLEHLAIGREAPGISGKSLDGAEMKLSDYRGKVVVVDFWASWCPHCQKMHEHERRLVKDLGDRPFALVGVAADEERVARSLVEQKTVSWRNWMDGPQGPITAQYRVSGFPTLYVLDHMGIIRYKQAGFVEGEQLRKWVDELLKETAQ
jgi:S1-C subfamily serine protease/thiol-disulfide isomerase/thioredoxin